MSPPTIASSESSSPSATTASFIPVEGPRQNQSLYDAVAGNSREDRFLNSLLVRGTTDRPGTSRAAAPETVLACRWRRNRQAKRDDDEDEDEELEELMVDEDEDVKMMQAGLLVPSDRK